MTQVFKVEGTVLDSKYRGAGMAIAAVTGGRIVNLVYLRDVFDDLDEDDRDAMMGVLTEPGLAPTIRELSAQGGVFVGICSCTEFIVR